MPGLSAKTAGLTDPGRVRPNNEDAVWVDSELGLLIVADGMGGHQSGEVASRMAIEGIHENFRRMAQGHNSGEALNKTLSPETNRLGFCVKMANRMIFEASKRYPKDRGMGTTCTAALIHQNRMGLAHVGDSRAYLIRRGELQQLTTDHSLVMDQVRQGMLTKEEAARSKLQNILTRALGTQLEVEVDLDEHPLFPDDVLLLCSDGLFKDLTEDDILRTVQEEPDPGQLSRRLIERATEAGGRDNITVAVARIEKMGLGQAFRQFLGHFKTAENRPF